jgi:acyl-CoA synthetase (AMP-forming)/AMP-acid ligase II
MVDLNAPKIVEPTIPPQRLNVADRLHEMASKTPSAIAVACPHRWSPTYPVRQPVKSACFYATTTFAELDSDASRIAFGLLAWGVAPGTRLALLVRPGIEFVTLVFALLRAGMVVVLVDPGLGRKNLIRCLSEAKPEGFVAIGLAQATRALLRHKFPRARWNVTVGRRWFWGGVTLDRLRRIGDHMIPRSPSSALPAEPALIGRFFPATLPDDAAAIIFTSGSTGPPKGVQYTHRMFDTQVSEIESAYRIEHGGIDLACFPLFALFNSAMGVTTVLPEMDFSRPATAHPRKLLEAANDWQVTQAFASPAVWRVVADYCAQTGARIDSLQQVFSCGAPVSANVLRSTLDCVAPNARMHTPYGATECLPVASIEAKEVLSETAARTDAGAGVCVGRKFDSIEWRVIRITDEPIGTIDDADELPPGEIGELIVRGPQVSPRYVTSLDENRNAKIASGPIADCGSRSAERGDNSAICDPNTGIGVWHRMGDVGYLDDQQRFWYCGRKSQRVETGTDTIFTECVEAVINTHPAVRRSALVGVGPPGQKTPIVIAEYESKIYPSGIPTDELWQSLARHEWWPIDRYLFVSWSLPVDVRHNAKINREKLARWAAGRTTQATSARSAAKFRSHVERGNEA